MAKINLEDCFPTVRQAMFLLNNSRYSENNTIAIACEKRGWAHKFIYKDEWVAWGTTEKGNEALIEFLYHYIGGRIDISEAKSDYFITKTNHAVV